jgi:hypothetical protein
VARAASSEAIQGLYALGVQEVASPEFEAAIEMTRQALVHLNVPAYDILRVASAIRRERYGIPEEQLVDERAVLAQVGEVTRHLDFAWVRLPGGSLFDGRTLGELKVRSAIGASVVAIVHHCRQPRWLSIRWRPYVAHWRENRPAWRCSEAAPDSRRHSPLRSTRGADRAGTG